MPSNKATEMLLKAVNNSCTALGHTAEAACQARTCYFATMDHFGLDSLFLTISPDDLRNPRVQLYAYANKFVSILCLWKLFIVVDNILNWYC